MEFTFQEIEQNFKKFVAGKTGNAISLDEHTNEIEVFLFNIDPENYVELVHELESLGFNGKIKLICFIPDDNRIDTFLRVMEELRE